jgi:UDP-N-acetylglucosamine acyltransferase
MAKINPTAIVHPGAKLADDVEIGPCCVVEPDVAIGPGTVLRESVIIRRYTTLGSGNMVDAFTVLGGAPQDYKFDYSTISYLRIGDNNVFREGVSISRATGEGLATVVGSGTYWMTNSHAGHNTVIEDGVVLVNNVAIAGHATIGRRATLAANTMVHQFCWVGELVMTQGGSGIGVHVPPFTIMSYGVNLIVGLNSVGLKRAADLTDKDRSEIKEAFSLTYRGGLSRKEAIAQMDAHTEWGGPAGRFREFIRKVYTAQKPYNRGIARLRMKDDAE